jgi:hypothetical protein
VIEIDQGLALGNQLAAEIVEVTQQQGVGGPVHQRREVPGHEAVTVGEGNGSHLLPGIFDGLDLPAEGGGPGRGDRVGGAACPEGLDHAIHLRGGLLEVAHADVAQVQLVEQVLLAEPLREVPDPARLDLRDRDLPGKHLRGRGRDKEHGRGGQQHRSRPAGRPGKVCHRHPIVRPPPPRRNPAA